MRYGVILFLLIGHVLWAQQSGRLETDRPDQTECPFIVKKGYFQAEIGFNRSAEGGDVRYLSPTSLLKIGVHPFVELRYTLLQEPGIGFSTESFGLKAHLFNEKGFLPRSALIVQYHLNQDRRDQSELNPLPHSIGETILTFQNSLGGDWGVGYNFGAEYHSDGSVEGIYRIAPNVNIGKRGYAYAEVFGRFPQTQFTDTWVDGGLAYYLSDEIKADVSLGKSLLVGDSWYVAVGISFRMRLW
jgi:hypothetical protein